MPFLFAMATYSEGTKAIVLPRLVFFEALSPRTRLCRRCPRDPLFSPGYEQRNPQPNVLKE